MPVYPGAQRVIAIPLIEDSNRILVSGE
jgi:hypothetical protein